MNAIRYVTISIACLFAGSFAGGIGGLALGWVLAFSYHKRGPSDPADAPVYAALALALLGAAIGTIVGLVSGIIYSKRLARKEKAIA